MMSDHLCSMNETLSKQREEIDTLKMSSKVCECGTVREAFCRVLLIWLRELSHYHAFQELKVMRFTMLVNNFP